MHRCGIGMIPHHHAACYLQLSLPPSLPLSLFSIPSLPPAHAKEALELARMEEQTAQVKHHEEFKVCVCVCVCECICVEGWKEGDIACLTLSYSRQCWIEVLL